jgi:hypothetical protein
MRSILLAASCAVLVLALAGPRARAADVPPEVAALEQDGEKWFNEAGRTDTSESVRNDARKQAWVNLYRAYEILDRFWEEHPESREKVEARLEKVGQMKFWIKKESPVGLLESTGVGPKHEAPAKPRDWPDKPPPEKPGSAPGGGSGGSGKSGNPFDQPAGGAAGAAPTAAPRKTIEQAFKEAEEYARKHKADVAGVMQLWQELLAAFAEQTAHPLFAEAAKRAGEASGKLKDVYRKMRDADPDSLKNVDSAEVVRMLLVLGRDLASQDSAVRERAAKTIGALGSGEGVYPLVKMMRKEPEPQALLAEGNAVVAIGGRKAAEQLGGLRDDAKLGAKAYDWLTKLTAKNPVDRRMAIKEIGGFALVKDEALAAKAVDFLVGLGAEGAAGLMEALNANSVETRLKVIEALGKTGNPKVARPLGNFLLEGDIENTKRCREAAIAAVKAIGVDATPYLFPCLNNTPTKRWTGFLLREITGQMIGSGRPGDWQTWWKKTHPDWKPED